MKIYVWCIKNPTQSFACSKHQMHTVHQCRLWQAKSEKQPKTLIPIRYQRKNNYTLEKTLYLQNCPPPHPPTTTTREPKPHTIASEPSPQWLPYLCKKSRSSEKLWKTEWGPSWRSWGGHSRGREQYTWRFTGHILESLGLGMPGKNLDADPRSWEKMCLWTLIQGYFPELTEIILWWMNSWTGNQ